MVYLSKPKSAGVSILINKYSRKANWLEDNLVTNSSPTWKGIVNFVDILRHGPCYRVGDGHVINVWAGLWVPWCPDFHPMLRGNVDDGSLIMHHFILEG